MLCSIRREEHCVPYSWIRTLGRLGKHVQCVLGSLLTHHNQNALPQSPVTPFYDPLEACPGDSRVLCNRNEQFEFQKKTTKHKGMKLHVNVCPTVHGSSL